LEQHVARTVIGVAVGVHHGQRQLGAANVGQLLHRRASGTPGERRQRVDALDDSQMTDSGHTIEASQIEPREAFRIEEAVNLDEIAARNRKPHHHEGPPVGHDDNPRGAIDECGNFDCGGVRRRDRSTRHFGRSTANERQCTPPFPAIRSQHHVGIQHCHEGVKVAAVCRREERIDDLSLTSEVGSGAGMDAPCTRRLARLASGFSRSWRGPAPYPSSEIEKQ
jgi:hypothetical protein